jgi:hypothetical protein
VACIVGPLCSPPDDEWKTMMKIGSTDSDQLRDLVRRRVVPHFFGFDETSQLKMQDSLEYFLSVEDSGLERLFSAFQIPLEPPESARSFLWIVWNELFGTPGPSAADRGSYIVDNSDAFVNSLRKREK